MRYSNTAGNKENNTVDKLLTPQQLRDLLQIKLSTVYK